MVFLASGGSFIDNPENWVVISFLIFCGILAYLGVPKMISQALDDRATKIKNELDEARRLREEAQALLADYQRKAREAEEEAKSIIERARTESAAMAEDAREKLKESLERRTRMAQDKIARAEAQAISDVKSAAVDSAIAAARTLVKQKAADGSGASLVDQSIAKLGDRLN